MKTIFCISLLLLITCITEAQSAKDSVMTAVKNLFTGMKNADAALVKSCFTENAVLQTIAKKGDEIKVENEPVSEFVDFVSKQTVGDADEQIVFDDIKIDGPLAMVWTPYQFYYKGKFSHCGVNSFQLVKVISGWKIQYIIDTRRKEGCK